MRKAVIAAACVAAAVAVFWPLGFQHWLAIHTGTDNEPGPFYGFWSGFGSDLSELALLAGVAGASSDATTATSTGAGASAATSVEGTPYTVCRSHHPEGHVSESDVRKRYHLYLGGKPGHG